MDYNSPWGRKESDTTERLSFHVLSTDSAETPGFPNTNK